MKKSKGMKLELIGGIYVVEEYAGGLEKREEIDGYAVLQVLLGIITKHAEQVISEEKERRALKAKIAKSKKKK